MSSSGGGSSLRYEYSTADSYYVLLTVMLLVVPPLSYLVLSGRLVSLLSSTTSTRPPRCPGSACAHVVGSSPKTSNASAEANSSSSSSSPTSITLVLRYIMYASWALLFLSMFMIMTSTNVVEIWDPYKTLNLTTSATPANVRKRYRQLSVTHHPDKVSSDKKLDAERNFNEINKAYRVLTEKKARDNWERYGNPDGPGVVSFGIALPPWLQNPRVAFFLYISLLVFASRSVFKIWRASATSKSISAAAAAEGIGHIGISDYVIDALRRVPPNSLTFASLLLVIAAAIDEAETDSLKDNNNNNNNNNNAGVPSDEEVKALRSSMQTYFGATKNAMTAANSTNVSNAIASSVTLMTIFGHMTRRLTSPNPQLVRAAAAAAAFALDCSIRNMSAKDALVCLEVRRALSAARLPNQSILLQLPFVMPEHVELRRGSGHASGSQIGQPTGDVAAQLDAALAAHAEFGERFTATEIEEMRATAQAVPRLAIEGVDFYDAEVAENNKGVFNESTLILDAASTRALARVHLSLGNKPTNFVCAPRFPDAQLNGVWLLLRDAQNVLLAASFAPLAQSDANAVLDTNLEFQVPQHSSSSLALTLLVVSPYYAVTAERRFTAKLAPATSARARARVRASPSSSTASRRAITDNNDDLIASFG